jgi:hypothetical protein
MIVSKKLTMMARNIRTPGEQVNPLPPLDEVLEELRDILDKLVAPHLTFTAKAVER